MRSDTAPDAEGSPAIARWVWEAKYRRTDRSGHRDATVGDSLRRVASALAAIEGSSAPRWSRAFHALMRDLRFLPGGRIIAGAGTRDDVTLFNCFVMAPVEDSAAAIDKAMAEGAATMLHGGGVGYDLSRLAPRGEPLSSGRAPGPVARLQMLDSMCEQLLASSARRGAMMATLRCDHPDILAFIAAKQRAGALRNFNLSVLVGDEFMAAVRADAPWPLVFPADVGNGPQPVVMRQWTGTDVPVPCRVHAEMKARSLWEQLLRAAYDTAEPGVLFVDRINATNNLWYRERISATNPCGEVPLPSYGACVLGSLNLPRFIRDPFTSDARLDRAAVRRAARLGVRMLDNAIDGGRFPLPQQAAVARTTRRVGLGIMGLADALLMLGLRYDSRDGRRWAGSAMRTICHAAYRTSIALAAEKGSFPALDRDRYLQGQFIRSLPADIRTGIARDGIRNSHLLAIAPTGSISLLAGAVSSGLEPIFAPSYRRTLRDAHGVDRMVDVADRAISEWQSVAGRPPLPPAYAGVSEIAPEDQLAMQAALQACVDNAISKTVTVAADLPFEGFRSVYDRAFDLGLKGCTVFRPGTVRGAVVSTARSCCHLVRD